MKSVIYRLCKCGSKSKAKQATAH